MTQKTLVIVAGAGDTMLGDNSFRKLKNNTEVRQKISTALEHISKLQKSVGVVDLNYPSDTQEEVKVFKPFRNTKVVSLNLNTQELIHKNNELVILDLDGQELRFNGDQFDYIFRPEEYEIILMGIDLHGVLSESIKTLLDKGYRVKLLKDALSTYPSAMKEIKTFFNREDFEFCSYRSIK